ncbi:Protein of unknown function (DUF1214) [Teratosphaeria destructans]|uniref:Beta-lactamase-related domain-containing protein n=1 Tax=Teratosphaeria destructans TaxID=418781 RepID=A0A9W7SJA2_9PEZI|nr:Protein of unknown function (DUF1214) [Teratosphaeria destructans]
MLLYVALQAISLLMTTTCGQQTNLTPQNATAFSLLYGYPLIGFHKLAAPLVANIGVNQVVHSRSLSTAASTAVVKPNVDTLYSAGIFDLSHNDVQMQLPEIPSDQYALFSFYDPYGDNFANVGTGNFDSSRSVDLRQRSSKGSLGYGLDPISGTHAHPGALIYSPSTYGIVLIRWLVNSTNLDLVHRLQDTFVIANATTNSSTKENEPYITDVLGLSVNTSVSPAQDVLTLLSKLAAFTGPEVFNESKIVNQNLVAAGITANKTSLGSGVDLNAANNSALAYAATAWEANQVRLNDGWSMLAPNKAGNFRRDYGIRAAVAGGGYLMLQAPNAIYPGWSNSTTSGTGGLAGGDVDLSANESLLYTFSSKPPLQPNGFWSLTAYSDNYLIPNNISVYALGDRSNMTYSDGSLVYGFNSSWHNGRFQILIQAADSVPPTNWTKNWLPSPAGGGSVSALLRWYLAEQSLLDGTYEYPVVTRQPAIKASGGVEGSSSTPSASSSGIEKNGGVVPLANRSTSLLAAVLVIMVLRI